ncbi:MAG TPA: GGDEF domain-containing protein [Solirubrobacterales bacterium]|nr:GGDEF domain-containing protein [Solirubrobacterales bacterium]
MESSESAALVALADHRFQSFAEAAETALAGLREALPGTIVLAQFDPESEVCRVTDLSGAPIPGLERGATLRISTPDGWIDHALLRSVGLESALVVPIELSDGNVVGLLCALDSHPSAYGDDQRLVMTLAARMLGYEWEGVRARAEVHHLRDQLRDDASSDAETGLANRDGFLQVLDREWRLAKRSSVQSFVVACHVVPNGSVEVAAPSVTLALKDAAEVLAGSARETDHVGRVGETSLAAILVGCDGPQGAEAFTLRYRRALDRVTQGRPFVVEVACAHQDLGEAASAPEALSRAEAASEHAPVHNGAGA